MNDSVNHILSYFDLVSELRIRVAHLCISDLATGRGHCNVFP
jgi:hypothetical protein